MPTVTLPWPDRRLHPNWRGHWSKRAKAVREAREDSAWWAKCAGFKRMKAEAVKATITFHAPDRRRRDADGVLSSLKAAIDGLSDVIGVDDSNWTFEIVRGEPREGGAVVIEVQAA